MKSRLCCCHLRHDPFTWLQVQIAALVILKRSQTICPSITLWLLLRLHPSVWGSHNHQSTFEKITNWSQSRSIEQTPRFLNGPMPSVCNGNSEHRFLLYLKSGHSICPLWASVWWQWKKNKMAALWPRSNLSNYPNLM